MRGRRILPPTPPREDLTYATKMYNPMWDGPAGEGIQQLIVSGLRLFVPQKLYGPPPTMPGILEGKRLLIKAQSLEDGANGKRLVALRPLWPHRGRGALDGSLDLTTLDKFLARVLGHCPKLGSFRLGELVGLNFTATVRRGVTRHRDGECHPVAYFKVTEPDCFALYDQWPSYRPLYNSYEREQGVYHPPELEGVRV